MTSAIPQRLETITISQRQPIMFCPIGRTAIQSQLCVKYHDMQEQN